MSEVRILEQFQRESDSWKRLLEFLQVENIHLKTRIAEIVTHDISPELLAETENYQNHFIRNDEMIALTRLEIWKFDNLITREHTENGALAEKVKQQQEKLRQKIESLELTFRHLKSEFNTYITENF